MVLKGDEAIVPMKLNKTVEVSAKSVNNKVAVDIVNKCTDSCKSNDLTQVPESSDVAHTSKSNSVISAESQKTDVNILISSDGNVNKLSKNDDAKALPGANGVEGSSAPNERDSILDSSTSGQTDRNTNVDETDSSIEQIPENSSKVTTSLEPLAKQMEISSDTINEFPTSGSENDEINLKVKNKKRLSTCADENCHEETSVTDEPKSKRMKCKQRFNEEKAKLEDGAVEENSNGKIKLENLKSEKNFINKKLNGGVEENLGSVKNEINTKIESKENVIILKVKQDEFNSEETNTKMKMDGEDGVLQDSSCKKDKCMEFAEEFFKTDAISGKIEKLKLKLKKNGTDEKEYELVKSPDYDDEGCIHCTCDCKFRHLHRGIIHQKVKAFTDSLSDDKAGINFKVMDDIIANIMTDWISNKSEIAALRKECIALKEEYERIRMVSSQLKKQVFDAKSIIKRLIDEKIAHQAWTDEIIPLRVTRSVGLQVCTVGSAHVLIRPVENDKEVSASNSSTNTPVLSTSTTSSSQPVLVNSTSEIDVTVRKNAEVNKTKNDIRKPVPTSKNTTEDDVLVIEPVNGTATCQPIAILAQPSMTTAANTAVSNATRQLTTVVMPKPQEKPKLVQNGRTLPADTAVAEPVAEEVIDLTANDTHLSASDVRPAQSRVSLGKTVFNIHTNNIISQNRVITVPADSTTYVSQRQHSQANTLPHSNASDTNSSSNSEMILNTLRSLPPLPRAPKYGPHLSKPPKPILRISKNTTGIMLSWKFDEKLNTTIRKYQLYSYQEGCPVDPTSREYWKKVGDVDALPLPMACTLSQFKEGHKYFFVVRAMDVNMRLGEFSLPGSIMLTNSTPLTKSASRV